MVGESIRDRLDEVAFLERLEHMGDRARLERALDQAARAVAGEGDDRHIVFAADLARGLDAVEVRQAQIDQDQVGPMLACELDGFDPVTSVRDDVEAGVLEDEPQICADDGVVFDREHASGYGIGWQEQPPCSKERFRKPTVQ